MDWEAPHNAVRSTDNKPISPNAARRTAARRLQQQQHEARGDDVFARIHDSPMVGDRRFNRRRQRLRRRNNRRAPRDEPANGWITDSDSASSGAASDASAVSRASCSSCVAEARRAKRGGDASTPGSARGKRAGRRQREWRVSQGVDRVLALMGTRVEEPTMVERLQMHRDIPYVISGYLQLGFNVFMVGTVLTVVVNVLLTIQRDVNAKIQEYSAEILQGISSCSKQYLDNRCDPLLRVPAMEQACREWENCMHRDPTTVGRARVSAETLAEIVNGFIEPISLKTMLFFVLMFFGTLYVSNFAFGAYRHSRVHMQHAIQSGGRSHDDPVRYAAPPPRKDDPLASPSPRAPPGSSQMLMPLSPSTRAARRDRSAHSVDRRRTPHR
ncbi:hypothetical protein IWQ56_006668 [Coemansia nantahalensis]|nr:hypothetical protein IWQ56_006668 [Coemansia nantahalensis]